MKLIGLGGTNGSGKDTVAHMLVERQSWLFISVSDLLRHEATARGLSHERDHLRAISNEWRGQFGDSALIVKALDHYKAIGDQYEGLALASIRNPGEVDAIHDLGGKLVWVDANPKVRYDRIQANLTARGRGDEDNIPFEQWHEEERVEMEGGEGSAGLHMLAVKDKADLILLNEGNDIEAFKDTAKQALSAWL